MTKVQELQHEYNERKLRVKETQAKLAALPERRAAALAALDSSAMLALSDAGPSLNRELLDRRIGEQKALLELLAAQRQENEKKRKELEVQTKPLAEQIKELQRQIAPLNGEINYLADLEQQQLARHRDAKRKLEDLLIELQTDIAKLDAPVVRSLPHMVR